MLRDPVSGFEYPAAWAAACRERDRLPLVERGLAVLTASGAILRRGFSTGTTAAAAATGAVLSLARPEGVSTVAVTLPCGVRVEVPVAARGGHASARKDPGDYPEDATAGVEIRADAAPIPAGIAVVAGAGIGRWTRDTPRARQGDPAISDTAMQGIRHAIQGAAESIGIPGVRITLSIPRGAAIAKKTLNPRIGIRGGISILGTSGLVEPWDDHMAESVLDRIERAERVVLTTGRTGLRFARLLFPDHEAVLVGVHIREGLERAAGKETVLCGLPGLILRTIDPAILEGSGYATVEELSHSPAWGAVLERTLARFRTERPAVRLVLVNREGRILGDTA